MPKTHKRRGKKGKKSREFGSNAPGNIQTSATTRASFRFTSTVGSSATAGTFTVTEAGLSLSNFGDRAIYFADMFAEWRLEKMNVVMCPTAAVVSTATQAVSYLGTGHHGAFFTPLTASQYTVPSSYVQITDFPNFAWGRDSENVKLRMGSKDLQGASPYKWLLCNATGTTEPQLIAAGTLGIWTCPQYSNSANLQSTRAIIEIDCLFRGPIDSALVPTIVKLNGRSVVVPPPDYKLFREFRQEHEQVLTAPSPSSRDWEQVGHAEDKKSDSSSVLARPSAKSLSKPLGSTVKISTLKPPDSQDRSFWSTRRRLDDDSPPVSVKDCKR